MVTNTLGIISTTKGTNLQIKGFLTPEDKEYIEAAKRLGIHDYMLSFVEEEGDMQEVLVLQRVLLFLMPQETRF